MPQVRHPVAVAAMLLGLVAGPVCAQEPPLPPGAPLNYPVQPGPFEVTVEAAPGLPSHTNSGRHHLARSDRQLHRPTGVQRQPTPRCSFRLSIGQSPRTLKMRGLMQASCHPTGSRSWASPAVGLLLIGCAHPATMSAGTGSGDPAETAEGRPAMAGVDPSGCSAR